ncbi:MAG: ABC transporter ATP-binding protein [Anaerolineaceae bacterium]|jgi:iron complex transport system ATP-binding protein
MLEIKNLCVGYGDRLVLHGLNLELPAGQILGVIGPNGAGKSTLIRTLSGILAPQSGQVHFMGHNLPQLTPTQRARLIAVVPQANQLPPAFTAWETVLMGRTAHLNWLGQTSAHDEEIVRQAMQRTDTLDLADRRVGELSGGEQQRLLLARALAQAAPLLLMDEPTAHLDLQYQYNLLQQVRGLVDREQLSVMIVLHDLNLVSHYTDRVALLVKGELRALGSPKEVLTADLLSLAYHTPLQVLSLDKTGLPYVLPPVG